MKVERNVYFFAKQFFVNSFFNKDRAIILASLHFSRQDESNDISFDPVWPSSKFALRAYMGSR